MRWQGRRRSSNVEDRRGMPVGRMAGAGGGLGLLIVVLIVALMGGDPRALLDQGQAGVGQGGPAQQQQVDPAQNR